MSNHSSNSSVAWSFDENSQAMLGKLFLDLTFKWKVKISLRKRGQWELAEIERKNLHHHSKIKIVSSDSITQRFMDQSCRLSKISEKNFSQILGF